MRFTKKTTENNLKNAIIMATDLYFYSFFDYFWSALRNILLKSLERAVAIG